MASVPPEQASADPAETELDEEIESLQARSTSPPQLINRHSDRAIRSQGASTTTQYTDIQYCLRALLASNSKASSLPPQIHQSKRQQPSPSRRPRQRAEAARTQPRMPLPHMLRHHDIQSQRPGPLCSRQRCHPRGSH